MDAAETWAAEAAARNAQTVARWVPTPRPVGRQIGYEVGGLDGRFYFNTTFVNGASFWLAEEAAKDAFDNGDGREWLWPVTIEVFDGDTSLGLWVVSLEHIPSFTACEEIIR